MKTLIIASIVIALICPTVVMAAHKKSHKTSTPQTTSPNLNGRVVHGSHALRAKVSVRAHGSRHTMHPSVTSGGQFTMHLKPGTYTSGMPVMPHAEWLRNVAHLKRLGSREKKKGDSS